VKKSQQLYEFIKEVRCPACNRKNFRYATRAHLYRCVVCGAVFDVDYEKKEVRLIHEKGD
jgi:DNA-directed RNA polymerase subunit RPC12/RpoP